MSRAWALLYTLVGLAVGLALLAASTAVHAACTGQAWWAVQANTPLLWVIDASPLLLGLFSFFAGRRQQQLADINATLDERISRQTQDLVARRDELARHGDELERQRRALEQSLSVQQARLSMLAAYNLLLRIAAEDTSREELLERFVRSLTSLDWLPVERHCALMLHQDGVLVPVVQRGAAQVPKLPCGRGDDESGLCQVAFRRCEVAAGCCLSLLCHESRPDIAARDRLAAPIRHGTQTFGVLALMVNRGAILSQDKIDFIQGAADILGHVLLRLRAVQEREAVEAQLAGAVQELSEARDCLATQNAQLEQVNELLAGQAKALEEANEKLRVQSSTDAATELPNRRHFLENLRHVWSYHAHKGVPLSVLLLDVDRFKILNDRNGHLLGDEVLKAVASALQRTCGDRAYPARFGGDEFAILAYGLPLVEAVALAEEVRATVASLSTPCGPVTVSIGAAERDAADETPAVLLDRADKALYEAKAGGRNRVCGCAPDVIPEAA
jgi:diguanylate cyclase (GGDEF)-like protein